MRSVSYLERINSDYLLSSSNAICYLENSTQINGIGEGFFSINICFYYDLSDVTPVFFDSTNALNGIYISYNSVLNAFKIGNTGTIFNLSNTLNNGINYVTINYNSSNQNATLFLNDIELNTENIGVVNTSTGFKLMNSQTSTLDNNCKGGLKDFIIIDRQQTKQEVSYFYQNGIIDESAHENCVFHFTNQMAYNDTINYINDVVENYNYAKTSTNLVNLKLDLQGWTNDELGLNIGTSTFTAYRDYETKVKGVNFSGGGDSIFYKGTELRKFGLSFDSSLSQYIEVEGFNPTKENGYTILTAFRGETNTPDTSFSTLFSKTNGNSTQYRYSVGRIANSNNISLVPATASSSTISNNSDYSNINFVDISVSQERDIKDKQWTSFQFLKTGLNGTKQLYSRSVTPLVSPELQGFDEMVTGTPMTAIGRLGAFNTRYYNDEFLFLQVWKGVLNDKEVKEIFNNGSFKNPSQKLLDKYELVLYPDFNNPFDDAGTLKIPDLSDSNHTLIAHNWTDLTALQNAKIEI